MGAVSVAAAPVVIFSGAIFFVSVYQSVTVTSKEGDHALYSSYFPAVHFPTFPALLDYCKECMSDQAYTSFLEKVVISNLNKS